MRNGDWTVKCALVLLGVVVLVAVLPNAADADRWTVETVDSDGDLGERTAIAVDDDGRPHIAYGDSSEESLKYAVFNGTGWEITTLDTGGVGNYADIALDADGHPHISYYLRWKGFRVGDLMYAHFDGSDWRTETVDTGGDPTNVGQYTSIALDSNGNPHISYYNPGHGTLKYARWTGKEWLAQRVDETDDVGSFSSLALDGEDRASIAYCDKTNGDVKFARWTDAGWEVSVVDGDCNVAEHTSLVIDDEDRAHVSYYDGNLRYACREGTHWQRATVYELSGMGPSGLYSSITLDGSGEPVIAFVSVVFNVDMYINLARRTGGKWVSETVAGPKDSGMFLSVAMDGEDHARISYQHLSGKDLMYARSCDAVEPGPPVDLVVRSADGELSLDWERPEDDGGAKVVEYRVYRGDANDSLSYLDSVGSSTTRYTDGSVTNGQTYFYRVTALSEVGEGEPSATVSALPLTVPGAPGDLSALAGDSLVELFWNDSSDDGGAAITGYRVYRTEPGGDGRLLDQVSPGVGRYSDASLTNGRTYGYHVTAVNDAGESGPSNVVEGTPQGPPTRPRDLEASAGRSSVNISWQPPESDGGLPIGEYRLFKGSGQGGDSLLATLPPEVLGYTDGDVKTGVTYRYHVVAVNALEESRGSGTVDATPMAEPSSPTDVRVEVGDGTVNVSWRLPADDGGSPVLGVRVYRTGPNGLEVFLARVEGDATHYVDEDVWPGDAYTYRLTAENSVGESETSDTVDVEIEPEAESPGFTFPLLVVAVSALVLWRGRMRSGGGRRAARARGG